MAGERHFIMKWPELNISVECEPLEHNKGIYEWWLDHFPIKAVQSHAAVTGDVMYTLNVRLPETAPEFDSSELKFQVMTQVSPGYGHLSYNQRGGLSGGRIGAVAVWYGPAHEEMETCCCFKVIDRDIDKLKQAGNEIWNSIYKTNKLITVELGVKK